MSRAACVVIDLAALSHNLHQVRRYAPKSAALAMVKANAYGHGVIQVANALREADGLGVACLEEAVQLRMVGNRQRIVLMEGFFSTDELITIAELQLDIVVHQMWQLEAIEHCGLFQAFTVWVKIDTGMHRLGFMPKQVAEVATRLKQCCAVKGPLHFLTHFACADDINSSLTAQQISTFQSLTQNLPGVFSMANSAAIIGRPDTHADWVRPGLMLYGVSPFADRLASDFDLRPVMTLRSELIAIHHVPKGESIGYGSRWICPEDMEIGIVAIGYGDGYPCQAPDGTPVLVNNKIVSLVGKVAMDMLAVDLRSQPKAKIGDPVVLWGQGLPVERIASSVGTIVYDLLCGITQRVRSERISQEVTTEPQGLLV